MEASDLSEAINMNRQTASAKKDDSNDRAQRCRERNRIHARKTRQRKKEQMQTLQSRAEDLKGEQLRLRQIINEKNTASILLGLFAKCPITEQSSSAEDPEVEYLLKRPVEEIPDASKVSELPALILPGQHASKNMKAPSMEETTAEDAEDGIDYELLGKDRSKCSPEELDRIRRERNRMHAKRTRDRKRLFTEQMSDICRQLEEENDALLSHLSRIDPDHNFISSIPRMDHATPTLASQDAPLEAVDQYSLTDGELSHSNQISKLLQAASTFEKPVTKRLRIETKAASQPTTTKIPIPDILRTIASSLVALSSDESSASDESHDDDEEHEDMISGSRKRHRGSSKASSHYYSMSGPAATAVGC